MRGISVRRIVWVINNMVFIRQTHLYFIFLKVCLTDKSNIIEFCKHSGMVNTKCLGYDKLLFRERYYMHARCP